MSLFPLWEHKKEVIAHIMDNFDFQKVHDYMVKRKWEWVEKPGSQKMSVPSVAKLKNTVLKKLKEEHFSSEFRRSCAFGGFDWTYYPEWCVLRFDDDSFWMDSEKVGQNILEETQRTIEVVHIGKPRIESVTTNKAKRAKYGIFFGDRPISRPGGYTKTQAETITRFLEDHLEDIYSVGNNW